MNEKFVTDLSEMSLKICLNYLSKINTAVDVTLGNGLDVEKFLPYVKDKFYAIDIQQAAIDSAKSHLQANFDEKEYDKVEFILDNHENIDKYVEKADLIVANLGYLPNNSHEIITKSDSTLICLSKGLDILNVNGIMSVTSYLGHDRGKEHHIVSSFFKSINPIKYKVLDINPLNQSETAPILFICQKVKP